MSGSSPTHCARVVSPTGCPPNRAQRVVQDGAVHLVESELVDPEELEALAAVAPVDESLAADLGEVAHPAQQSVGHPGRAPRALGDPGGALAVDADTPGFVLIARRWPRGHQGRRGRGRPTNPNRSRRGPATRPVRVVAPTSVNRGRSSRIERAVGPLPIRMSRLRVLHGRVEHLLDRSVQPMDLVDEEDVAVLEVGEQGG